MSIRRLLGTAAVMAATAAALHALTPDLSWLIGTGLDLQQVVDARGPESLLLGGVAALAWGIWAWGVLGLLLTALSALPGMAGAAARVLARGLLPASARRAAALALGVGLVTGGPLLAGCTAGPAQPGATVVTLTAATEDAVPERPADDRAPVTTSAGPVADWPDAAPAPVPSTPAPSTPVPSTPVPSTPAPSAPASPDPAPDWPLPAPGDHVVLRGECLWDIAAGHLRSDSGREPTAAEIVPAVHAWWQANAAVIGPDPDLLLPGQVLHPPAR
ncbi:LysM peptidoglycan-binding domain-containing protein [Geodermatophilus sp. SYSU D00697]